MSGEKVEPKLSRWSREEIDARVVAEAVEAVFSENGADLNLYDGKNEIDFSEKLYVRGSAGKCIISTFDNEDEEIGYFIDHSKNENDRVEIKGDLSGATTVCFDKGTVVAIVSDYLARRDLTLREYWEAWSE